MKSSQDDSGMAHNISYGPYGPYILVESPCIDCMDHIFLVESPYMDRQSVHFWKKTSIYGSSVSPFLETMSIYGPSVSPFLEESLYVDRQSVHFWKKVHIWTSRSILTSSLLPRTFRERIHFGNMLLENEHGNLGNNVKTNNFLKMAPQAKPLCP